MLFLYQLVLKKDFGWLEGVVRAKRPKRLPTVFTRNEVSALLNTFSGLPWSMACMLYGGGLRLKECLSLRVKDVDFQRLQITVRDAKGEKDRVTLLPQSVVKPLRGHLAEVRKEHERAIHEGYGGVYLATASDSKSDLSGEQAYDLVVTTRHFVVRVPKAGCRLIGKPHDRGYRVCLR